MRFVISFGRTDGSATKLLFPKSRTEALEMANSLSYVLFREHSFRASECHTMKRVEQGDFYVMFDYAKDSANPKQLHKSQAV